MASPEYKQLGAAVLAWTLALALGLSLADQNGPAGLIVTAAILPLACLLIGRWRVHVALWIVLTVNGLGAIAQVIPPVRLWRLGLVALNALAATICVRALATDHAARSDKQRQNPGHPHGERRNHTRRVLNPWLRGALIALDLVLWALLFLGPSFGPPSGPWAALDTVLALGLAIYIARFTSTASRREFDEARRMPRSPGVAGVAARPRRAPRPALLGRQGLVSACL